MSLRNLISKSIMIKAKSIVAQLAAANAVPSMFTSKNSHVLEENEDKRTGSSDMISKGQIKAKLTKEQLEKLFHKLDLNSIEDWISRRGVESHQGIWFLICFK